jgi:tRNA G18 (ribose-2'-O)-methylase SpoU
MSEARIEDPRDPRVADYVDLRDPALRRAAGRFVVEGRLLVRRLLAASRFPVRSLLVTPAARAGLGDLLATLEAPVYVADAAVLRAIVGFDFHRGCLAVAERGAPPPLASLLAPAGPRLLVGLEDVRGPDNVGAVLRNARAFGAAGALLSPATADPLYRLAIRASAGASLTLPFARAPWPEALAAARTAGYTVLALTPDPGATDIAALGGGPALARAALLVGSEGGGLTAAARAAADVQVRIAMEPGTDSLNVATATGIALHRLREARRRPP